MRRLVISTEPNTVAMARMWIDWMAGITQKCESIMSLSLVFWIAREISVKGVVRSH